MMFSDDEIKEIPESSFMRPGDEIISIREVCLVDKLDKRDYGYNNESLIPNSGRNDLDVPRMLRDGFFPESLEQQQARFAWTEEDGNIASLVSEPGFGTTGQTTFGKDLDAAFKSEMKEADTSSAVFQPTMNRNGLTFSQKPYQELHSVSSTSVSSSIGRLKNASNHKVDKSDPRSRFHYVKYVKRHGRTVKVWECGICSREFQHQYTLMRHLPTHTDERNFHCTACGKSFRQLSTLSQHKAIHSADRPYACEECNKTFNRVSTLISHRKTHSDQKPYRCHICTKGFHQKGNLRNHLFTHTNERPYRCNICYKGFNQQSNLVCHKNKAHPEENGEIVPVRTRNNIQATRPVTDIQPDINRSDPNYCEVTSSVGPYLPSIEGPAWTEQKLWGTPKSCPEIGDVWNLDMAGPPRNGVIVDAIRTYHMEVALATKQTPFALLKPDNGTPVLVKVVDTQLPGGKQMLVPATAEDLRIGGKIVVKNEENDSESQSNTVEENSGNAVQIRVPVVATVVPRINVSGKLHLVVEEPHHAYHTAISADGGNVHIEPCSIKQERPTPLSSSVAPHPTPRPPALRRLDAALFNHQSETITGVRMSASCTLPPPAPSPTLDLISLDLFEPMECIPIGPQITAVDGNSTPPSDDSDIFIRKFEESIPLSESD